MNKLPQPIPYQGSKRSIAHHIIALFPEHPYNLIEPFAGSAAISVAAAATFKSLHIHLNDLNAPLMNLWHMVVSRPNALADQYETLWHAQLGQERTYYDWVRDQFNKTQEPHFLLYLLARCVKASVRYNASGEFNQSPDNRRKGRHPVSMRQEICAVSNLLKGRTKISSHDYKVVLEEAGENDLVYLDPPYQGTSQNRDPRYYSGLSFDELVFVLDKLNQRGIMYILSYDGRTGQKQHGKKVPTSLGLICLEICAGRSTQSTLSGGQALTYESIYVSPALVQRLPIRRKTMLLNTALLKPESIHSPKQLTLGLV